MLKILIFSFIGLVCVGCSSIEKVTYYKVASSKDPVEGHWSYESTTVHDTPTSNQGFPAKLIYKKKWRWGRINHYQYAQLAFAEFGNKVYTMGPVLLPIIPVFTLGSAERKIKLDEPLSFTLGFWSDPVFEVVTATLPNLELVGSDGRILKGRVDEVPGGMKRFTYDVKIRDLPWFVVREAEIKLSNGRILKIPETRFELDSSVAVNFLIPFGP